MRKGIWFFLVAALLITTWLRFLKNSPLQWASSWSTWIPWASEVVKSTIEEVDLNTFLKLYKEWAFEKIELKDVVKLQWYQEIAMTGEQTNIFGVKIDKLYKIYTTNKQPETALIDLGIDPNGSIPVTIIYEKDSVLSTVFMEQILPLIFFILVLVLAFKFFWPKWGWLPFGAKAGILRTKTDVKTKFKDVAGMDEAKDELIEIVDFLKNGKKYQDVGAKIPKWVLLYGPPGSGKTLLARAVAGEANVPFFSASGSEFMEMLVGMGAAKVRDLFKKAKTASPSIIFIDEIDTIGKKRGSGYTGGHQEQEQTLNQILTEMDGFEQGTNVIVIAATNRPDTLDSALMRSGRFDRKIMVGRPTLEERAMILKLHAEGKKLDKDVDLELLARRTSGFVGADLANIINEAALRVAKENRKALTMDDFEYALEKLVMGPEKKIKSLREKEKKIVTYHELGHAVTTYNLPNADPVEKISIVSRGMALGVTWMMPEEDSYLHSKAKFLDDMVTLLGGRAAEEIFFGKDEITTGASNDFEKVTHIAHDMILKYGMDEELGTLVYFDRDKGDYIPFKPFSEKTSEKIDLKVKWLVSDAYKKAIEIITKNKKTIEKMAMLLYEKEYLTKEEFMSMMADPKKIDELIGEYRVIHAKKEKQKQKTAVQVKKDQDKLLNDELPLDKPTATPAQEKKQQLQDVQQALEKFLGSDKKKKEK